MENKAIWGVRAGSIGEAEAFFLNENIIALGWHELGDLSGLQTREDFKNHYASIFTSASKQHIATSAGQLYRFTHEMQVGDIAAFPGKLDRKIHLGRVKGEYEYNPGRNEDYPNQRKVEWLRHIPRTNFSQAALYEMGSALTLFQIKNYADEIFAALEGKPLDEVVTDEDIALDASEIEELSRDFILRRLERNLKGLPFEPFIQHLLETMGYEARLTDPNEPSVDIIASKDKLGFEPPIIKVQVKTKPGNTDDRDVSALYGKINHDEFGLFITLGDFTSKAAQFANTKSNLRLINGTELVDLIFDHYEEIDPKYKGLFPLKRVYVPQLVEGDH